MWVASVVVLQIMQLPLTDLAVFVNVDSIFRVSLYAARDKETVQKLLDTGSSTHL